MAYLGRPRVKEGHDGAIAAFDNTPLKAIASHALGPIYARTLKRAHENKG
tara:strand:- start:2690 stop:2839 length:150 start_codon:yes stop_codon:yes gene_type:complete